VINRLLPHGMLAASTLSRHVAFRDYLLFIAHELAQMGKGGLSWIQ